jgi:hypothetical protein
MCALCAALGASRGWHERAGRPESARSGRQIGVREERSRQVAILNQVLTPLAITVRDWSGSSYVVRNAAGRSAEATNPAAIWNSVDALAERPFDPLDPEWIAAMIHVSSRG